MPTNWKKDRKYRGRKGALRRDQAEGQERAKEDQRKTAEIRGRIRNGRSQTGGDR